MGRETTWEKWDILLGERKQSGGLLLWKFALHPNKWSKENSLLEIKMCNSRQTFVHSEHPVLNTANSNLETYVVSNNTHKSQGDYVFLMWDFRPIYFVKCQTSAWFNQILLNLNLFTLSFEN